MGCWGLGSYAGNQNAPSEEPPSGASFSQNDSIIWDIVEILKEEKNLDPNRREEIEKRIASFPGRIIRRDTASYFLQTALTIAYNEYTTENFPVATEVAKKFNEEIEMADFWENISRYFLIKFTPSVIKTKEKIKNGEKISQFDILNLSSNYDNTRDKRSFLNELLIDIPINLNIFSYKKLLRAYKNEGGIPSGLNSWNMPTIYHFCHINGRQDILDEIISLWNLEEANFAMDPQKGIYKYVDLEPPSTDFRSINQNTLNEFALAIYDIEGNILRIDSLISIGQQDSIGKYVDNYQNLSLQNGKNREVIEMSAKYEKFVPQNWKHRFYNYWGIAHITLGEFDKAQYNFKKAIDNRENLESFSGAVINYALALAEDGRCEDATQILETQKDKMASPADSINYFENLGYITSLLDPIRAKELYDIVDKKIETTPPLSRKVPDSFLTRHFAREARLWDHDLFKWREILKSVRFYSGEDNSINLYGSLHNSLYHSEMGRYRNFLFDFEGAAKDFEAAQDKIENLDSTDYRVKWWSESWQALSNFRNEFAKDPETILRALTLDRLSPLHKLWLIGNLTYFLAHEEENGREEIAKNEFDIGFINDNLNSHLAEAIMALASDESRFLIVPILTMQQILMPIEARLGNPKELARLNLLRKGLLQTSKTAIEKELMAGGKIKEYENLKAMRKALNHAYIYEDSLRIKKLSPLISAKERELYYSLKENINIGEIISTHPESIILNLKENDIAIDFIEYGQNDSTYFGAFLYFPDGEIKYLPILTTQNESSDPQNPWRELWPFLEGRQDIYFSPDGSLINEGIEFYEDQYGEPLFQTHRLHRMSHLRNLNRASSEASERIEGEIAVFGVADHNSPVGGEGKLFRGDWTDLPDVEHEMELIENSINGFPHQIFFNDDAIEENVKAVDGRDISVLHFSTHGVYRNVDSLSRAASDITHFDHQIAQRILKTERQDICGIVLRKGNLTWRMPHLLDDEDDILTAEEIEIMNFPNLQLTVLSACDSGLGEINSDGSRGLQKAFRSAGSKNIICSLNKVDDYWSAQFMGQLYKNLTAGLSIYDSFREAQKSIKTAAPFNPVAWASYILIE
ncbi:MAG: CHAT domain-containing protein [Muribaculaceae bacterium]|nr:CHAT domain-containing protein [Muribaculaceae bacterium]